MADEKKEVEVTEEAAAAEEEAAEPIEHEDGVRLAGSVKKWLTDKGYGFVSPDDGSKDVFVHGSVIEQEDVRDLNEGEKVTFTLKKEDDGRLKASEVKGPNDGPLTGEWEEGDVVLKGIVARWRGDKGFGFIKPEEGDKDIFAHINETGVALTEGMTVEYICETGSDGRLKASKVKGAGGRSLPQPVDQPAGRSGPMRGNNQQAQQMQMMQMMRMRQMQQMQMQQQMMMQQQRYRPY